MATETLALKWGTLKRWDLQEDGPAFAAVKKLGSLPVSAMATEHDETGKLIICEVIDALDNDQVYLDWDGKYVSEEEAKKYIMDYDK